MEEFGEFMRHPGEEFLYVIEGELELHTQCYAPVVLKAGESIYLDSGDFLFNDRRCASGAEHDWMNYPK